ncbi:MAG: lysozyme inhibitor LprI family protein [Thiohalomonadales bacterium]
MKVVIFFTLMLSSMSVFADNCNKPRDDFDGLYCLNKVYGEADKELNIEYKKLRTLLTKTEKNSLKKTQIKWIKNRNNTCSLKQGPNFFVSLGCTTKMTVSRTNTLRDRIRECNATGCQSSKL